MSGVGHVIAMGVLALAVAIAAVSSLGLVFTRGSLVRLHFAGPPATISAVLVAVAAIADGAGLKSGLKLLAIAALLFVLNAIVTHATARAVCIRGDDWPPREGSDSPARACDRGRR